MEINRTNWSRVSIHAPVRERLLMGKANPKFYMFQSTPP